MINSSFEQKIGFDRIKELVKHYCYSETGKIQAEKLAPLFSMVQIEKLNAQVEEFVRILDSDQEFPTNAYFHLIPALNKTKIAGARLELDEAWQLKLSLETLFAIQKFFKKLSEEEFPKMHELNEKLILHPFVLTKLNSIFNRLGKIVDTASPELAEIRRLSQNKQQAVHKRIHQVIKEARLAGIVDSDAELTIREGRLVIPIPSSNKRKIPGVVHDESATGKTSFVEPSELFELNNEIRELQIAEQREIVKILFDLSEYIRPYCDDLIAAYQLLGIIDFIRAKAVLARTIGGIKPKMVNEQSIQWKDAIHPLLWLNFKKEKKKVVPLTIELEEEDSLLLISGPNAGGKSVCLKTVGLLQYMFQSGLLVPVQESSVFGIFRSFFIDIGDEQSIENDLSTYSSHLTNMKNMLKNSDEFSLILIDELGGGTEPLLGGAIAESILEEFLAKKVTGIITTHYTNLKHFALSTSGIVNAAMLYDQNKMEPLFQLSIGKPGSSFAFEIARKIGLPERVLQSASAKIGPDQVNFDKILKEVSRDKKYWENKRKSIRKEEKKLLELNKYYQDELSIIERERKKIIQNSKDEAGKLLQEVNKKIENTISQIREEQAEKVKTRKLRQELEDFKKGLVENQLTLIESNEKLKRIQDKEEQLSHKIPGRLKKQIKKDGHEPIQQDSLKIGDYVKLINEETIGELIEMNEKNLVVAFGNLITSISKDKVSKLSNHELKKIQKNNKQNKIDGAWNLADRRLNFSQTIDIRGERVDDAIQKIGLYLDECLALNIGQVRILHGTGNGILRQHIREYIKAMNIASWLGDEALELGGPGITIVKF